MDLDKLVAAVGVAATMGVIGLGAGLVAEVDAGQRRPMLSIAYRWDFVRAVGLPGIDSRALGKPWSRMA